MTAEQWLACADPLEMARLSWLPQHDWRLRLFACACCRAVWGDIRAELCRASVEVAERFAYGKATVDERRKATVRAHRAKPQQGPINAEWVAAYCTVETAYHAAERAVLHLGLDPARMVGFFHCIFDNHVIHQVALDPSWLTSTVVQLARGIYDERAFDRLPILADALQDAGCECDDVLEHCRGDGAHVRGCWVVDLLLGKA